MKASTISEQWLLSIKHPEFSKIEIDRSAELADRQTNIELNISPGEIAAVLQAGRRMQYEVTLLCPTVDETDWQKYLQQIAKQPSQAAAFYSQTQKLNLVQSFTHTNVDMIGNCDLNIECTCRNDAAMCNHVLATIGSAAAQFDDDPFEYLFFKGKSKKQILQFLEANNTGNSNELVSVDELTNDNLAALPTPVEPPKVAGELAKWPETQPNTSLFTLQGLKLLANYATQRAHRALSENEPLNLDASFEEDEKRFEQLTKEASPSNT